MIHRLLTGHWPDWLRRHGEPYRYFCRTCGKKTSLKV